MSGHEMHSLQMRTQITLAKQGFCASLRGGGSARPSELHGQGAKRPETLFQAPDASGRKRRQPTDALGAEDGRTRPTAFSRSPLPQRVSPSVEARPDGQP